MTRPARRPRSSAPRGVLAATIAVLAVLALPGVSAGDLSSQLDATQQREQALRGAMHQDTLKIEGLQGRLDDIQKRLGAIETSLDFEQRQLDAIQTRLRKARARLVILMRNLRRDRRALAAQLRTDYESAPPDAVSMVMSSTSFGDLLQRVDDLKRVEQYTVITVRRIKGERAAVSAETKRLTQLEASRQRIVTASRIQRDVVARLRDAVATRQQHAIDARDHKGSTLAAVQARGRALQHKIDEQAAAAARALGAPPASGTPFAAHGGSYGFFQAAGTNYSVGDEPEIAARLDRLGKALGLHLIGISGYRSPAHSVAVGGFPNDPHTRGQASDTPGVEGVPEATLNQYGLTRPFGGAAEADHIQLLGSI